MRRILILFVLFFSISIQEFPCAQSLAIKASNSCLDYYTFENNSLTPYFDLNEGWRRSETNSHTGKKSLISQLSARRISRLSMNILGQKDISFWWYSDSRNNSRLLFRVDNEPNFKEYTGAGWNRVNCSTYGENSNNLNWIFYAGSNDTTAGIDDLCIQGLSCDLECPEDSPLSLPLRPEPSTNVTSMENVTFPENRSNFIQAANITLPETFLTEGIANVTITENATRVDHLSNLTQAPNVTLQNFFVINGCNQPPYIFPSIQEAINAVPPGSTINLIKSENEYMGGIIVNKSISLVGNNATIRTSNSDIGCYIVSNDAAIIRVKFVGGRVGIKIEGANRCSIKNNKFNDSILGVVLIYSEGSKINGNILEGMSRDAIRLISSINNTIEYNSIIDINMYGIYLERSDFNNIDNNIFENNYINSVFLNRSDENQFYANIFTGQQLCDIFEYNSSRNNITDMEELNRRCEDRYANCICHNAIG